FKFKKKNYSSTSDQNGGQGWSSKPRTGGPSTYNVVDIGRSREYSDGSGGQVRVNSSGVEAAQEGQMGFGNITKEQYNQILQILNKNSRETQPSNIYTTNLAGISNSVNVVSVKNDTTVIGASTGLMMRIQHPVSSSAYRFLRSRGLHRLNIYSPELVSFVNRDCWQRQ
ncbi:hypothetical protein HAX54_019365, partial [Datura stramonium]|nr:hypothetical protein [Datura stramonium]